MRKSSIYLLIATSLLFCLSVSASAVGERSYTEPAFAMYAGYSGSEVTESGFSAMAEIAYTVSDLEASLTGATIESLDKLKPDKQRLEFIYTVIKPTKLAVMQNCNCDRVLVNHTH